jgi:hypothetical protein
MRVLIVNGKITEYSYLFHYDSKIWRLSVRWVLSEIKFGLKAEQTGMWISWGHVLYIQVYYSF